MPSRLDASELTGDNLCEHTAPHLRGWTHVEDLRGAFRVWFKKRRHADEVEAQAAAAALDAHIWSTVTGLYRRPVSDGGHGRMCRGGSDALDFVVTDLDDVGVTPTYKGDCATPLPAFVLISRGLEGKELKGALAHELAHAAQLAYPANRCRDPDWQWLSEATATWTEDKVYGGRLQTEHVPASWFLERPDLPLDAGVQTHMYGSYLFFFFLDRALGKPGLIDRIWRIEHKSAGPLPAIQELLGPTALRGLPEAWKKFALYDVNRKPVDYYWRWDQLLGEAKGARPHDEVDLAANEAREIPVNVKPLAATYRRFHFGDDVKQIEFRNPLAGKPQASVQAVIARGEPGHTTYRTDDWSKKQKVVICRDKEDVNTLTVVFSNGDYQHPSRVLDPNPAPKLTTRDQCNEGWPDSLQMTFNGHSESDSLDETWSAHATLDRLSSTGSIGPGGGHAVYGIDDAGGGQFDYHHWWEVPGLDSCSQTGSGGGGSATARVFLENDGSGDPSVGHSSYKFSLSYNSDPATFHTECDSGAYDVTGTFGEGFDSDDYEPDGFPWDGAGPISGATGYEDATHSNQFEWQLTPQ